MRLPDFSSDAGLTRLRERMDAPLNADYEAPELRGRRKLSRQLKQHGIEIDPTDLVLDESLLIYEGHLVLLYIRDQIQPERARQQRVYKYHIANCQTLARMFSEGRGNRYVVANRRDGMFFVQTRYFPSERTEEGLVRLSVCKNCLKALSDEYPEYRALWLYESFDLEDFFECEFPVVQRYAAGASEA